MPHPEQRPFSLYLQTPTQGLIIFDNVGVLEIVIYRFSQFLTFLEMGDFVTPFSLSLRQLSDWLSTQTAKQIPGLKIQGPVCFCPTRGMTTI